MTFPTLQVAPSMKHAIDAIYEHGTFRPLRPESITVADGQRVRITIDDQSEPEALQLAGHVYEGLSDEEIDEIERIALDRSDFFGARTPDR